ncbi:peptidase M, neutral zinc metallopeptidase site [Chlorogloeopsis sp. ULAP02]|uniref:peptidase M, neutral zinc metallopeptidase site n=1 Tax=Chlorogloeopsis sp. ULAP02 TaxID=3107926 RepID=UPI003135F288
MSFLDSLNAFSKSLLGVGIVDAWQQAPKTKAEIQKAQHLAQNKQLREAVSLAQITIAAWSSQPGFWERLMRQLLLGNILDQLKEQLKQWQRQVVEADKLVAKAKALLKQDTGNPLETQALSNAINFYKCSSQILVDARVPLALKQCQQELERRQQFQKLVKDAELNAENQFYHKAIACYREAEQLYSTEAVTSAIATCETNAKQENIYCSALQKAQLAEKEGKLQAAIALLESALTKFSRSDGVDLLQRLQQKLKGKQSFRQGLAAEKAGNFKEAASQYEAAKLLLPDPTECKIRLGIVAMKTHNWAKVLAHLEGVGGEQAAYLRGFAYAKQGNLQIAYREWENLPGNIGQTQREIIKTLSQRQRLQELKNIEILVKNENLEQAKIASTEFLQKFGSDPLVEGNLNDHIQLRLDVVLWQGDNWEIIADTAEQSWILQPNYTTLHNWLVATYYSVQCHLVKIQNIRYIHDFIIALSTALANLNEDPALKDIPWLGSQAVDFEAVSLELKQRLEDAIDSFKDTNIKEYFELRDRYRLEKVALNLMGNPPTWGMSVKDVLLTPQCYNRYFKSWQNVLVDNINRSQNILRSLYSSWGLAVAACLEGDIQRAIQIKPSTKPTVNVEVFAQNFIAYHEGCYHLQQNEWRKAIIPLNQAKLEIKASIEWQQEIDRLCGLQRQVISELKENFKEHLEFAQFWYNFLASPLARSYLAEYKAEELREKLANEEISSDEALQELQKIKKIDESNPVVISLIEKVEVNQELEEIDRLFRSRQFEAMVRRARYTPHQRVRFIVAEFFIDILLKGVNNGDLREPEVILQLGRWAYEICPDEPAFQEVYRSLRLHY